MPFLAIALLLAGLLAQPGEPFDFDRTMRVDYFHTGGPASGEIVALDRVVNDGAWAGSRTQLLDRTNFGKYRFEVRDRQSGRAMYSRGFASIYGEWETTTEAKTVHRTFQASLRFPWPTRSVSVVLQKRQADNSFADIWTTEIDPESRFVNPAPPPAPGAVVRPVFESGPAHQKVDLLVISEGYTQQQMQKFRGTPNGCSRRCSRSNR